MLFSISTPGSKLILADAGPLTICALMYGGTITGMGVYALIRNWYAGKHDTTEAPLVLRNLPALTASSVFGSILAPAMLLVSLQYISAPEASLLTSFVAVTNTVIAVLFFREAVSSRIWVAISLITIGCMSLSFTSDLTLQITPGILGILLTCIFWGFEAGWNRSLSDRDPVQVQIVKGVIALPVLFAGAYLTGEFLPTFFGVIGGMLLGFFCYSGLPMILYLLSMRNLGISRAGSLFGINPIFGTLFSFLIFREWPGYAFVCAFIMMLIGMYLLFTETHIHLHHHPPLIHEHRHIHDDGHHQHLHTGDRFKKEDSPRRSHSHLHAHEEISHKHPHRPDIHHRHLHQK